MDQGSGPVCQCLPGFGGPECEKLLSVNFVDRDTYLQFTDLQNWPRANITLQVRRAQGARSEKGVGQVRAVRGIPTWENWEEPVLIKTLWMWVKQMWEGYWVTKAISEQGRREQGKGSRGPLPPPCLACSSAPVSSTAHSPYGCNTARVGSGLQLWPCIFSLLALGPLLCHSMS